MLQLSIKPQKNYKWFYTATGNYSEYAADTSLFGSLNTSYNDTADSFVPHLDATASNVPNGTWQSYYQTGSSHISSKPELFAVQRSQVGAATPQPFSGVKACMTSTGGNNGIYQRVYGLQDGKTYNLQFTLVNPLSPDSGSVITLYELSSSTDQTFTALATGSNTYDLEFEANGNTADICINISSDANECYYIKKGSVKEHYTDVDYTFSDFEDGSVDVDLYDDHIPLSLSIASFTDATSNTQSYSKDFQLPSTKNNDKIFTHIYDLNASIEENDDAFNPYIKTIATLKEDGIEIFSGELTLNSINKNTDGITYDVNLQSRVSGLAEVLKSRKLDNIDLTHFNHDYNTTNIKASWTTGLVLAGGDTTKDIKYPFVDWTGNITEGNVAGDLELSRLEDAFKPFINVKYLFDKIFTEAGFSYESDFLNSDAFTKLFMDLNNGQESIDNTSAESGGGSFIVEGDRDDATKWFSSSYSKFRLTETDNPSIFNNSQLGSAYWDSATYSFKPLFGNTTVKLHAQLPMFNTTNFKKNVKCRTVIARADGSKDIVHSSGNFGISGSPFLDPDEAYTPNIEVILGLGDELYFEGATITSTSNVVRQQISSDSGSNNSTWVKVTSISSQYADLNSMFKSSRGDISQWDYIKSFMNMFNLIVSPTEDERANHLSIEPYDSVFGLEGIGNAINDPYFTGFLDSDITANAGITTQLNSAGELQISTNGTSTVSYASVYYPYEGYIDGETYTAKIVVEGFTTGNSFKFAVQRNGGSEFDQVISSSGEYEFSFVFDKSANGGSNQLRVRLYMLNAQTNVSTLRVSEISVRGKFQNTIVKKDWSDRVDMDTFDMKMMDLNKRVDFKFKKDGGDYVSKLYTESIPPYEGREYVYGNMEFQESDYTSLTGIDKISTKPFASTLIKSIGGHAPLNSFVTPAIYTMKGENEYGVFKNKPRLLYDNGVATTSANYSSPDQNAIAGFSNESEYLQFTTFSEFDNLTGASSNALDLNWTTCQSFVNNSSPNGLFNEYWLSYYGELYHPDTRIYVVKAFLNNNDIANFRFTDIIVIENSEFRVNSIGYNAGGMSKIELIKLT
tara:strand:- start:3603 stop:6836 length:3234 start_codon:yes stop_codon:yes gene_type:complete